MSITTFSMTIPRLSPLVLFALALSVCGCGSSGAGGASGRAPAFGYAKETEGGCADIFLHKGTKDNLEVLWIAAEKDKLGLPEKGSKTFDLADAPDGLQVAVDLWQAAPRFSAYCNDIAADTDKKATWKAIKGKVTVTLHGPAEKETTTPKRYRASAKLEGIVFDDGKGRQATLKEETITEVLVGWYAG